MCLTHDVQCSASLYIFKTCSYCHDELNLHELIYYMYGSKLWFSVNVVKASFISIDGFYRV